jgi:hypothetical protein
MAVKTTAVGRPRTSAVKEDKATAARKDAEWVAKQAGQTPAQIQAAGQAARVAVDPRLANPPPIPINHGFGPNGGKGGVQMAPQPKQASPAPKPASAAPAPAAPAPKYDPTPLTISGAGSDEMPEIKFPEMPPQMFAPGGVGAGVDGNAGGFRRKKSSARMAGLTSKGTGQFKITGQSGKSSGLNIGV